MNTLEIAESFSSHRFPVTYEYLAPAVRWVSPGQGTLEGRDAVVAACEGSSAEIQALAATEFTRFVSVGGPTTAAVDAIGRYTTRDGVVSVVSSADIYEFDDDGLVTTITSYAVEMD